ncbi:MAG: hypothetical protein M3167_02600 [Acidobacteriota bacterium]|nr:hypothetical protein [Acidobacteriota bacterium]
MTRARMTLFAILFAGLALSSTHVRAQDAGAVWVTTDPARVAGCESLGTRTLADRNGLDLLRSEAARLGANVLRLTQLSERGIAAELYRCGASPSQPASIPSRSPAASPTLTPTVPPTATPMAPPASAATPAPIPASRRSSRKTPLPPSTAERQRAAHEEFESLKASIAVVSDPRDVEGCEKRGGGGAAGTTEDSLREDAVAALANVILVRRGSDGSISGDSYRCPRVQYQRLLAVTPAPAR